MDPSSEPGPDAGPDSLRSVRVPVDHPTASPSRPLRNVATVALLLGVLATANGNWSAARDVQHRMEMGTDYEPAAVTVTTTVPVADVTTVHTVIGGTVVETTTSPGSAIAVAEPAVTTIESATTAVPAAAELVPDNTPPVTDPALVSRPIPPEPTATAPLVASPWADRSRTTAAGYTATDVGCASGTSAGALDAFFAQRIGPVLGHDYQHVYPLGGSRYIWLFQDTFIDYSGTATSLGQAVFAHNTALIQDGACFTLYHRGSIASAKSFEAGTGESRLTRWFWPMGGQTVDGKLFVFWVEMQKDGYEPLSPNGLGWHPSRTWLAVYDASTLARLSFAAAPNSGVAPIYGYSVESDAEYTYLFGNTFEQNLQREGGYFNGPHSGTNMWLARVPVGEFGAPLEYRTADGWTWDAGAAQPITQRYWAENPMQPRHLGGQWVAVTKVNGYWGESLSVDVANDPWGPWTTVENRGIDPRGGDPLMNTYHAHLMPWLDNGSMTVSISQNARNMLRDAWPHPARYRLAFFRSALVAAPTLPAVAPDTTPPEATTTVPDTTTTSTSSATLPTTTSSATSTTTITTTLPEATSTTGTILSTTTTTGPPATTTLPATSTIPATTTLPATSTTVPAASTTSTTTAPTG